MPHPENANDIYEAIYQIVRQIPRGRVTSYGTIAAALGMKSGARLVGYAMNNCHAVQPPIPAQRVVNRNGLLTGKHHFGPGSEMAELLRAEGLTIIDDQIQDYAKFFLDPAIELGIL